MNKVTTNLTIDPIIKRKAISHAKKCGISLSALITFLLVKAMEKN